MLSEKQAEFIREGKHRWNFKIGATGTGKTYLDFTYLIPQRLRERHGKEGLNALIGVTQQTVERNVLEPMREYWGPDLVGDIRKGTNKVHLFGEDAYVLGAEKISSVARLRGSTLKYCYGDETVDWNKEVFQLLKSRLRTGYSLFDGTGNPQHPKHWLKLFIDSDADVYCQQYKLDDNPFLPDEVREELKKEYFGTVEYNRYILGEWCNAEGLIFKPYADNPKLWEVEILPFFQMVNIGLDIGGTKSHSTLAATGIAPAYSSICTFLEKKIVHAKGTIDTVSICRACVEMIQLCILEGYYPAYIFVDNAEQVILNSIRGYVQRAGYTTVVWDCKKVEGKDRILVYNLLLGQKRMLFRNVPTVSEALATVLYDEKKDEDAILDDFTTDVDSFDAHFYSWSFFMDYITAFR